MALSKLVEYDFGSYSGGDWTNVTEPTRDELNITTDTDHINFVAPEVSLSEDKAITNETVGAHELISRPFYAIITTRVLNDGPNLGGVIGFVKIGTQWYGVGLLSPSGSNFEINYEFHNNFPNELSDLNQAGATDYVNYTVVHYIMKFNLDGSIDIGYLDNDTISPSTNPDDYTFIYTGVGSWDTSLQEISGYGVFANSGDRTTEIYKIGLYQDQDLYFDLGDYTIPTIRVTNSIYTGGTGFMEVKDKQKENLSEIRNSLRNQVAIQEGRHNNYVFKGELSNLSTDEGKIGLYMIDYLKKLNRIDVGYNPITDRRFIKHITDFNEMAFSDNYAWAGDLNRPIAILKNNNQAHVSVPHNVVFDPTGDFGMDDTYGSVYHLGYHDEDLPLDENGIGGYNTDPDDLDYFRIIATFYIVVPTGESISSMTLEAKYRTRTDDINSELEIYNENTLAWDTLKTHSYNGSLGEAYPDSGVTTDRFVPMHDEIVPINNITDYLKTEATNNRFGNDVYSIQVAVFAGLWRLAEPAQASIEYMKLRSTFNTPYSNTVALVPFTNSVTNGDSYNLLDFINLGATSKFDGLIGAGFSVGDTIITTETIDNVLTNAFNASPVSDFISTINVSFDANDIPEDIDVSEYSFLELIRRYDKMLGLLYYYDPFDNELYVRDSILSAGVTLDQDDVLNYPDFEFNEDTVDMVDRVIINTSAGTIVNSFVAEYSSGVADETDIVNDSSINTEKMLNERNTNLENDVKNSGKNLTFTVSLDDLSKQSYANIRLGQSYEIKFPTAGSPTTLDFDSAGEGELTLTSITYIRSNNTESLELEFTRLYL